MKRFSSIKDKNLSKAFFKEALQGAKAYDRIAGYFSSSILELAGEELEAISGKVRIVCNSQLRVEDVKFIKSAHKEMKDEWCETHDPDELAKMPRRLKKLYKLLTSKKIEVRVVPTDVFGLIHGKAGVITKGDGSKEAFLGSMNETYSGWSSNYELVWVDEEKESIDWVQSEFDFLWTHPSAKPLAQFIIEDIKRISERKVIYEITEYQDAEEPAAAVIEAPVYRKEFGLWEHQKYFVDLAYKAHKKRGARFVLADMVGLGKTLQLALSAQLIALESTKPILIIAPKTLLWQWQEELMGLLEMPTAVWDGKQWVDENKIAYPVKDASYIKKCPRRVGIISQGLIVAKSAVVEHLLKLDYECIIVDETHRARRKNFKRGDEDKFPEPNNLMEFLLKISPRTRNMLLATATPVQMYPIEAWDLLYILSQGNDFVLGDMLSKWQTEKAKGLRLITESEVLENEFEYWDWIRNPMPPGEENEKVKVLRRILNVPNNKYVLSGDMIQKMKPAQKSMVQNLMADEFILNSNPFIRHIVRRTRSFLETQINPETNEPYLSPIEVKLYGEEDGEAIYLKSYFNDAYQLGIEFSQLLKERVRSSGFIKTLLLRRLGSTMIAGLNTALKMLNNWSVDLGEEDEEDEPSEDEQEFLNNSDIKDLTREERQKLEEIVNILEEHKDKDPKYDLLKRLLTNNYIEEPWLERGCIVFSQYFDSIQWIAEKLTNELPNEKIGLYAGGDKSGIYENGVFKRVSKEEIKKSVKNKELRLLLGTDAASEGLNLQKLSTLINLDLPWNPTRLEQRKGRIQRIGQERENVLIYNMRYKDSVEDRVHQLLSQRLKQIEQLFGQIPDTLRDVWVDVALNNIEEAEKKIYDVPKSHPFSIRYEENVKPINWESCKTVLDKHEKRKVLTKVW